MMKYLSFILILISACTNITQKKTNITTTNNPAFTSTSSGSSSSYTHTLTNVAIGALTSGSTAQVQISLSVDTSSSSFKALTAYCSLTGTNLCQCQLDWNEVNTVGGQTNSYSRTKKLSITDIQSGLGKCVIDQTVWNEIPSGTQIKMNIVPASGNASGLSVKSINYKTGTSIAANGDFLDSTLTPFRNIFHYSCFTKSQNSHEILNAYAEASNTDSTTGVTTTYDVMLGSQSCSGDASSSSSSSSSNKCQTPRSGFSAQSYYRNFYLRSDRIGQINSTNNTFDCPKVVESINVSANPAVPLSEQGKYWPMDTSFALATTYSSDWSVGVRAASILYKPGDPNGVQTSCVNEDITHRLSEGGTITQCIGYAKKPMNDGTCGSIQDNNGRVRPLVRLRRFRVVYPAMFTANGNPVAINPFADEIYSADRLVLNSNGVSTGDMIYGPKPCNFAWFDHEGVTNRGNAKVLKTNDFSSPLVGFAGLSSKLGTGNIAVPTYIATSKYYRNALDVATGAWNPSLSVSPDGLVLPNYDYNGTGVNSPLNPSCSSVVPVVQKIMGTPSSVSLVTTHLNRDDYITLGTRNIYLNEVHVQPVDPWSPDYLEDTSFKACVPVADPYLEPPMHFYNNGNTMSYCTKSYPTQNPYWIELNSSLKPTKFSTIPTDNVVNFGVSPNTTNVAKVLGYTSHVDGAGALDALNSCTGTNHNEICAMTGGIAGCTSFLNKVVTTCDRTVMFDSNQEYRGFPLQAADADIESMLSADQSHDKTYTCQYSVSSDPSKVNSKTPSSGCCGLVNGTPVLNGVVGAFGVGGHLEPYTNPAFPTIRFCGNPVQ